MSGRADEPQGGRDFFISPPLMGGALKKYKYSAIIIINIYIFCIFAVCLNIFLFFNLISLNYGKR